VLCGSHYEFELLNKEFVNEISFVESLKILGKAYGEFVLSKTCTTHTKAFEKGREVVKDLSRSDRPSTSSTEENIDKV